MDKFKAFIDNLAIINNLYDIVRIVDPINKKVIYYDGGEGVTDVSPESCYGFWKFSTYCLNCISMRAINEHNTYVKIQYNKERIFMVIAAPLDMDNNNYILEMMKDVTSTGIVENFDKKTSEEIESLVYNMNSISVRDELTGVYNRRLINEKLPIDILKSVSLKKPLSLVMADIDYFKSINDNYGHLAGDYILQRFATIINDSIREESDWIARYGGDEFVIILGNTYNHIAHEIIDKIKKKIESETFLFEGQEIKVTASFGICTLYKNNQDITVEKLIKCADEKMYEEKRKGRIKDQTVVI